MSTTQNYKYTNINYYQEVNTFINKMKIPVMSSPALLKNKVMADRLEHLKEEVEEFGYANNMSDLPGCVDALIDTVYVALGTAIMMGLDEDKFRECWLRVHQANMKKEVKKIAGHKFGVSKPDGWQSPELGDILNNG